MYLRTLAALLLTLLPTLARAADDAAAGVTIERTKPTSKTKTFDPKRPPSEVKLNPNEAAVTHTAFLCECRITYTPLDPPQAGASPSTAKIRVEALTLKLSLENTIYLPTNATKKLTAHEQAHRRISEAVYESAEEVARRVAAPVVGRTFTGTGATPEEAARQASRAVMDKVSKDYLNAVSPRSAKVNEIFDRITDHGRNDVAEEDAIRRAFQRAAERPAAASSR